MEAAVALNSGDVLSDDAKCPHHSAGEPTLATQDVPTGSWSSDRALKAVVVVVVSFGAGQITKMRGRPVNCSARG